MRVLCGTSGYAYEPWVGRFYPAKLPSSRMLAFYSSRLPTVELNGTFRTPPTRESMARLPAQVPEGFVFAAKGPQQITHFKRLKSVDVQVADFFSALEALGERRGPVLFQLPHNFKKDLPLLEEFLARLPPAHEVAFDFRHDSWLDDDLYLLLAAHGAALCIADEDEACTPPVPTAHFGYLRLRRTRYGREALAEWAETIAASGWERCFVYFRHEETGTGPRWAKALARLVDERA